MSSLLRARHLSVPLKLRRLNTIGRPFATLAEEGQYAPGTKLHGYTVKDIKKIPEFEMLAVHLQHDKTNAEHLHIAKDDKNNVFSIAFKTNPPDASGVPHILEHTTLCGSEKYQVRDPFFKMLNRSLANFMNAMTASDYTFYPFATTNQIDYSNLRDVYLDATLHPLLRKTDFTQEGWRLEHEDPKDPSTHLTFKGVVYNEMKGQMSDSSYLYYIKFQESIYPSLNNSGGDPAKITDLTYEQLRNFHAVNYHPSNAKVFTYGNFSLEEHLKHLNERFSAFAPIHNNKDVKYPIELKESKEVVLKGPVDLLTDPNRQYKTSLTWYLGPTNDSYLGLCLRILTSLLTDGHSSLLYQALIESDLGTEYSSNSGLSSGSPVNIFSVGLQGVSESNVSVVHDTIHDKIRQAYNEGFEISRVEAFLHQAELYRKNKVANFGLNLLYGIVPGWFNQVAPLDILEWDSLISRFREDLKKPRFLESILEKYFLGKPTFAFTMIPSEDYGQNLLADEEARLNAKINSLTEADKKNVYETGLELLQKQEEKEDLSSLPTLRDKDIPLETDRTELEHNLQSDVPVQWRITPTNGLTYVRGLISLQDLPQNLHPYLPLFAEALTNLGTETESMASLEDQIKKSTGGISAGIQVNSLPSDIESWNLGLTMSGFSLNKDVSELLRLLSVLLLQTNFHNYEKLRTLIRGMSSGAANVIAESGHIYALGVASSSVTASAHLSETLSGMEQVKFIAQLDAYDDASLPLISQKLAEIASYAFTRSVLKLAVTCGTEVVQSNEIAISNFINGLPNPVLERTLGAKNGAELTAFTSKVADKTFYNLPFQVNYAGVCSRGVAYDHKDGAALQVLANLLTNKYLHSEIREKGGAYGGGASYNATSGIFSFYSYRDPNPRNTFATIDGVGEWAVQHNITDRDLVESKLSIFQGIDAPTSVQSEGMIYFLQGIDDDARQVRRQQLLNVGISDVKDAASKYLVATAHQRNTALLGVPDESVSESNGWRIAEAGVFGSTVDQTGVQIPFEG
ncbi:peptidase M16C associated-domain-containing protein [Lipomyces japonicus]|uniref:peptidase M16C associated-domain-containing protein n=1 Tax=Lipomyces japonicus TaxID=56871 RepID=UPI0034CE8283